MAVPEILLTEEQRREFMERYGKSVIYKRVESQCSLLSVEDVVFITFCFFKQEAFYGYVQQQKNNEITFFLDVSKEHTGADSSSK